MKKWEEIAKIIEKKGHSSKGLTRRDFLSHGITGFSALASMTTFGGAINRLYADECGTAGAARIPFLVFDCAGGAALPANFLVKDEGGQLLPSYDQLGWDPKASGAVDNRFGAEMGTNVSKIFQGMTTAMSADAQARLRMGTICHSAQSDTSSNPLNALSLVTRWGYRGDKLAAAVGSVNSQYGANSIAVHPDAAYRSIFVPKVETLVNALLLDPATVLGKASKTELATLFDSASGLSEMQIQSMAQTPESTLLGKLMRCAFKENKTNLTGGGAALDPRTDPIFQQVYQINAGTASNSQQAVFATITKGVLSGATGPGAMTFTGCDYHDGTQTTGDAKDLEIGTFIGRAVEAAHRMKKPLFFQIVTDGGVSNKDSGSRMWVSDDSGKCMTVVGYYRPEGAATMVRNQLGFFDKGQSANPSALTGLGSSPGKAACSAFANYLRLHLPTLSIRDFTKELTTVAPSTFFKDESEIESMLFFG